MSPADLFHDKRFWIAVAAVALLTTPGVWWMLRSRHREEVRSALNGHPPFQNPALELSFPSVVPDSPENRELLQPGVRLGLWSLRTNRRRRSEMEVRLSDDARLLFSQVGTRIIATFKAGIREVIEVEEIRETFPTRQVRFRYVWRTVHPAAAVLGPEVPAQGQVYEGDALLFYRNERWNVLHWTTATLADALARFQILDPVPPEDP